jgi:hypothetical protein
MRRDAFAAPNQGLHHLQADRQPTRRVLRIPLRYAEIESTVCYLGVDVEDVLALAADMESAMDHSCLGLPAYRYRNRHRRSRDRRAGQQRCPRRVA